MIGWQEAVPTFITALQIQQWVQRACGQGKSEKTALLGRSDRKHTAHNPYKLSSLVALSCKCMTNQFCCNLCRLLITAKFLEPKHPHLCHSPLMPQWCIGLFYFFFCPTNSTVMCSCYIPRSILTMEPVRSTNSNAATKMEVWEGEARQSDVVSSPGVSETHQRWKTAAQQQPLSLGWSKSSAARTLSSFLSSYFLSLALTLVLSIVTTWGKRSNLSAHIPIANLKTKTNKQKF